MIIFFFFIFMLSLSPPYTLSRDAMPPLRLRAAMRCAIISRVYAFADTLML